MHYTKRSLAAGIAGDFSGPRRECRAGTAQGGSRSCATDAGGTDALKAEKEAAVKLGEKVDEPNDDGNGNEHAADDNLGARAGFVHHLVGSLENVIQIHGTHYTTSAVRSQREAAK